MAEAERECGNLEMGPARQTIMGGRGRLFGVIVAAVVALAACTGAADSPSTSGTLPSEDWLVDLDVTYEQWLRIPGTDAIPVRRILTYAVNGRIPVDGETVVEPTESELTWQIECQRLFLGVEPDPDAVRFAGSTAIEAAPARAVLDAAEVGSHESLLPAVGTTQINDEIWLLHNLPDVVPLGEVLQCPDRDWAYVALRPNLSRVALFEENWAGRDYALNARDEEGNPRYLDRGGDGSGWVVARVPEEAAGVVSIDFVYEDFDVEVNLRLAVTGTARPAD